MMALQLTKQDMRVITKWDLSFWLNINQNQNQNSIIYYTIYDREYDERGTIDTYESEVVGIKYDLSKTLNDHLSFGLGS